MPAVRKEGDALGDEAESAAPNFSRPSGDARAAYRAIFNARAYSGRACVLLAILLSTCLQNRYSFNGRLSIHNIISRSRDDVITGAEVMASCSVDSRGFDLPVASLGQIITTDLLFSGD